MRNGVFNIGQKLYHTGLKECVTISETDIFGMGEHHCVTARRPDGYVFNAYVHLLVNISVLDHYLLFGTICE